MSKNNNVNPGQYDEGDRNRRGDGIVHEDHKDKMGQEKARREGQGSPNFIPGQAPEGETSKKK